MKQKIVLFILLFACALSSKTMSYTLDDQEADRELSAQLASFIHYPAELAAKNSSGIVVVKFKVNDGTSIGNVKVFSDNQRLNADIIRQLTGKKLVIFNRTPLDTYMVKLIFRLD